MSIVKGLAEAKRTARARAAAIGQNVNIIPGRVMEDPARPRPNIDQYYDIVDEKIRIDPAVNIDKADVLCYFTPAGNERTHKFEREIQTIKKKTKKKKVVRKKNAESNDDSGNLF